MSRPLLAAPALRLHMLEEPMEVKPAEKELLLLMRRLGNGELQVVFRDGVPMYAEQIHERVKLGQYQGGKG